MSSPDGSSSTFWYFAYGIFADSARLARTLQAHAGDNAASPILDSRVGYVSGLRLSFSAVSVEGPRLGLLNVTPAALAREGVDLAAVYRYAPPSLLASTTEVPLDGRVYGVAHRLPVSLRAALYEVVGQLGSYNVVATDVPFVAVGAEGGETASTTIGVEVIAALDVDLYEHRYAVDNLSQTWRPLPPLVQQPAPTTTTAAEASAGRTDTVQWGSGRWPGTHWCNCIFSQHVAPSPAHLKEVQEAVGRVAAQLPLPPAYTAAYAGLFPSLTGAPFLARDVTNDEKEQKTWYLAYGSNLSWEQVCVRIGPPYQRRAVQLNGYVLVANKMPYAPEYASFGYYNVEPVAVRREKEKVHPHLGPCAMPDYVFGAAYEMSQSQLELMDKFEGGYHRELLPCQDMDSAAPRTQPCWVYIAEDTSDTLLPSKEYLARVLEGGDILPAVYMDAIKATPTNPLRSPRQDRRLRKEL